MFIKVVEDRILSKDKTNSYYISAYKNPPFRKSK